MPDKPKGLKYYDERFGLIAIKKGFITEEDLINALSVQVREDVEFVTHRQVGEILFDLDIMNANQIEEVAKETIDCRSG